jgi:hypothetical protein
MESLKNVTKRLLYSVDSIGSRRLTLAARWEVFDVETPDLASLRAASIRKVWFEAGRQVPLFA